MPFELFKWGVVVAMRAQREALWHPRLRLADDEFVITERTASTGIAAFDEHSLRHRPRVFTSGAVHALGFDRNELHVTAAAPTTRQRSTLAALHLGETGFEQFIHQCN